MLFTGNSHDEFGQVFQLDSDAEILHYPGDELKDSGVSMKPDRVVGLSRTSRFKDVISDLRCDCQKDLTRELIKNRTKSLYPFLVVEAKKEKNAPGFRAIERQSAFPIRRLLKTQYKLQEAIKMEFEPPLIWFLAFQGEEWRLYGATYIPNRQTANRPRNAETVSTRRSFMY